MRVLVISDIHANYTALEAVKGRREWMRPGVWATWLGMDPTPMKWLSRCVKLKSHLPAWQSRCGNHRPDPLGHLMGMRGGH